MTVNTKNILLNVLAISLIIIGVLIVSGCRNSAATAPASPSVPSASTGSVRTPGPGITQPTSPASLPSLPVSSPTPAATNSALPSSSISTSIPIFTAPALSSSPGAYPVLLITAPLNVSTIPTGDVTITTVVSNFKLVDKPGQTNTVGEGHLIYYKDVVPPIVQSQKSSTAAGTYAETTAISYIWHNIDAGDHYFSVQLVNNDGTPLLTPVTVTVYVTTH